MLFKELGCLFFSAGCISLYWWWITGRFHGQNQHTNTAHLRRPSIPYTNRLIRNAWVNALGQAPGADILAVQTLRNAIMVASALASATILTLLGAFTLLAQNEILLRVINHLTTLLPNLVPNTPDLAQWLELKLLMLGVLQLLAFYSFLTAIRYYGHVSFLVTIPQALRVQSLTADPQANVDVLPAYLQRAGDAYSIGLRLFLFSIPMFAWLLGNPALLATTGGLLILMYLTDRH